MVAAKGYRHYVVKAGAHPVGISEIWIDRLGADAALPVVTFVDRSRVDVLVSHAILSGALAVPFMVPAVGIAEAASAWAHRAAYLARRVYRGRRLGPDGAHLGSVSRLVVPVEFPLAASTSGLFALCTSARLAGDASRAPVGGAWLAALRAGQAGHLVLPPGMRTAPHLEMRGCSGHGDQAVAALGFTSPLRGIRDAAGNPRSGQ